MSAVALTACVAQPRAVVTPGGPFAMVDPGVSAPKVVLLLPLTGTNAELGRGMLRAAQVALDGPGVSGQPAPVLDVRDTGGTPAGAAAGVQAGLAAGGVFVIGPLTAAETQAVAPITRAANVPVLAFTSDVMQAQPGVWPLGITPAQQVERLVGAVQKEGRSRIAAVLPQNSFGDALANGLQAATAGLPDARVARHPPAGPLAPALNEVADTTARHGPPGTEIDPATPPAPVPFDTLLLGAAGAPLLQALPLSTYDIVPPGPAGAGVRVLGTALWARDEARLGPLRGAWYAAPDPAARAEFNRAYSAKFNVPPRELTSLAFDAAAIARVTAVNGFDTASLTRAEGFRGADGLIALGPDGQVRRGLAVFELDGKGSHIVQPAPASLAVPGM